VLIPYQLFMSAQAALIEANRTLAERKEK